MIIYRIYFFEKYFKLRQIYLSQREPFSNSYIISGKVFMEHKLIVLLRNNFIRLVIPFDYFKPNAIFKPDFEKFKIIDNGLALKLGEYEASLYTILNS